MFVGVHFSPLLNKQVYLFLWILFFAISAHVNNIEPWFNHSCTFVIREAASDRAFGGGRNRETISYVGRRKMARRSPFSASLRGSRRIKKVVNVRGGRKKLLFRNCSVIYIPVKVSRVSFKDINDALLCCKPSVHIFCDPLSPCIAW